jgi:predicted Mrr-cat superfamily restriction endonuclease
MTKQAFIIRCAPSYVSRVGEMFENNQIVIGWSETESLLFDPDLDRDGFKEILKIKYPNYINNSYSLGQGTGYLWRFIREMQIGDYAIVPIPKAFYIGEVTSNLIFLPDNINEDTAIRRNVKWLNYGKPIPREYCSAGLVSRLKYQGTCVGATDLINEIESALETAKKGDSPSFKEQLNDILIQEVHALLKSDKAYLDSNKFEKLVRELMIGLGAKTSEIPPRSKYKNPKADVDVIADFITLGLQIYIQVKKHKESSDKFAVEQLIEAMKIDNPDGSKPIFGWVITSSEFNDEAVKLATDNGIRVINGDELAEMIVAVGLDVLSV